tara:strand:+ start:235 stop:756 length:522 start_codon:yes stop_codon:yes gene_type:complete
MIEVIDDLFPPKLVSRGFYFLETYPNWDFLADSPESSEAYTLGKCFENNDYDDIAKEFMSYMDRQDFKRVLYNAFQSSDCPKPHVDSQSEKGFTYMIYLNPDWDVSMGGETIFVDEPTGEIIKSIVPKRGRLVKFTSVIPHSARPPLRDCMRKRYSMVFQTHPIGLETLGDLL